MIVGYGAMTSEKVVKKDLCRWELWTEAISLRAYRVSLG